jgi:hypothetical protein
MSTPPPAEGGPARPPRISLLRRDHEVISARLLAGTLWPQPGMADTTALTRQLLASAKTVPSTTTASSR